MDFGAAFRGQTIRRQVDLRNEGVSDVAVTWEAPSAPFAVVGLGQTAPAGTLTLTVTFAPTAVGNFDSTLTAVASSQSARLALTGQALDLPLCPQPLACHAVTFDVDAGQCVETELADGTLCDPHDTCVVGPSCQKGACVGTRQSCDDGNACTLDLCDAIQGCLHPPAPPCAGDGLCQVGTCDPKAGCLLSPAPDGTVCGQVSCTSAQVCIAGSCVSRVPPDGFVCAPASPCQPPGICQGMVCQLPAATPLAQTWSEDTSAPAAAEGLHDFVIEDDGSMSLMGFFAKPSLRANTPGATTASDTARRCILWNGKLACADYFGSTATGKVSLLDLATGIPVWTLDLVTARPDFAALTSPGHLFMARVASLGSDHLAALFEGFPAGSSGDTQCRDYFLVILDTAGTMVAAQQVDDPMLDVCNHPHPFGVVSDADGRLYIAFSPAMGSAPLQPTAPTLMMAFQHDGSLMWKRLDSQTGGELASARGYLFPERAGQAYVASSGVQVLLGSGAALFGRPVATINRVTASPTPPSGPAAASLFSYRVDSLLSAWTYTLPSGDSFLSDQIRLVDYQESPTAQPKTQILAFALRQGVPSLMAVNESSGTDAWSCPLGFSSTNPPQLFEVAQDALGTMEGAQTCGNCDPPFVGSRGLFRALTVPGLRVPTAPWLGAFGGPGHSHHESLVLSGSGAGN